MRKAWLLLTLLSCADNPAAQETTNEPVAGIRLDTVVTGLQSPVHLTSPVNDGRLFIVEQTGRIRIVKSGHLLPAPFLDITDRVQSGGEQGLLSVAFHPSYATNGFFYVNYTGNGGDTRIERYHATPAGDVAEKASAKLLLEVDQPYANHNGGLIKFGPDGFLYIGMGDGGSGGDPQGNGQNRNTLLGAMLRIDVDRGDPYAIPAGNPYANGGGAREIWATGLRNPWRFSFDATSGLLIIADVGQNEWEEVHAVAANKAGVNYGWNIMEGTHCYRSLVCNKSGLDIPILEYAHSDGCSITGGYVYRGKAMPSLAGTYFYSDYCRGWIRSFKIANGQATQKQQWDIPAIGSIASFGVDAANELYVLTGSGAVYRIAGR